VLVPASSSAEGLALELRHIASEETFRQYGRTGAARIAVQTLGADARFAFTELAAGRYWIGLALWIEGAPSDRDALGVELEVLQIDAGADVARELDLRPHFPASVVVKLTGNVLRRRPALHFLRVLEPGELVHGTRPHPYASFDREGRAAHRFLAARPTHIALHHAQDGWSHVIATALDLQPGSQHELAAHVELHSGVLRALDADGSPCREQTLGLLSMHDLPELAELQGGNLHFDAEGRARVELPAGTYRLFRWRMKKDAPRTEATFTWPSTEELRVQLEQH
jgi:hypothetical protein